MKILKWNNWGMGARLIFITVLPMVLITVATLVYLYHERLAEAVEELAEQGRVIATSLADSSEYAIISGNFSDLDRIANSIVKANTSIYKIELLNIDKRTAIRTITTTQRDSENRSFEMPIVRRTLPVDFFSEDEAPHTSGLSSLNIKNATNPIIGYVRITMSPSNIVLKQKKRFHTQLLVSIGLIFISILIAVYLVRNQNKHIAGVIVTLRQIRVGNYLAPQVNVSTGGEIGELQTIINEMSVSLHQAKEYLEKKIRERTKELEISRNKALKSDAEKRMLIQKMNSIVEDERNSIAIEIHDELNAYVVGARLESQRILTIATSLAPTVELEEIKIRSQSITDHAKNLYKSGRAIVTRLRPEVLDALGLHGAIHEIVRHYNEIHPNCNFSFYYDGDFSTLNSDLAMTIYRLSQETLSNVVKHSKASNARAYLVLNNVQKFVQLAVTDDGIGFNPEEVSVGIGIIGMRERVHSFNGKIEIHSAVNEGTEIIVRAPIS